MLDSGVIAGFYYEAGVVVFVYAVDDFGIGVGASVGAFLTRQAEDDPGVIVTGWRRSVRSLACSQFEAGPFAPEIETAGGFYDVGDVGAAYSRGYFQEIKFAVGVGA